MLLIKNQIYTSRAIIQFIVTNFFQLKRRKKRRTMMKKAQSQIDSSGLCDGVDSSYQLLFKVKSKLML
nr:hypothetical protein [Tanacetum cinerariifolium]